MLSRQELSEIKTTIESDPRFAQRIAEAVSYTGKESGHSNASPMEDTIREILVEKLGAKAGSKKRSLADVVLRENLINVKFGSPDVSSGKPSYGQPNMCSMNRIMKNFYNKSEIDSYYIVKVNMHAGDYSVHVFDMLDYIDYLTWNSGTGQIMLKESEFYSIADTFEPSFTIEEKKQKIKALYDFGSKKHILLRVAQYMENATDKEEFVNELSSLLQRLK